MFILINAHHLCDKFGGNCAYLTEEVSPAILYQRGPVSSLKTATWREARREVLTWCEGAPPSPVPHQHQHLDCHHGLPGAILHSLDLFLDDTQLLHGEQKRG